MSKISLLFPNKELEFKKISEIAVHDIGMDTVINKLSAQPNERQYILNVMSLITDDKRTATYRADVFNDIISNPSLRENIMETLDRINFLKEYGSYKHDHDHNPGVWDLLHRLDEIGDYIAGIDALRKCLSEADIHSEGLLALKDYVNALHDDNGFEGLRKDIEELKANTQNLKSVTVGINLNERFEACGIGIISLNNKPFTKSHIISHFIDKVSGKDNVNDGNDWDGSYKFDEFTAKNPLLQSQIPVIPPLSPLALMSIKSVSESDESTRSITNYMDEITERMLSSTVKHLREILGKYTMLTITDITDLMPEFIYYIRWAEFIEKLIQRGFQFCKPDTDGFTESSSDATMYSGGVYNMKLIIEDGASPQNIVSNNLTFDREHCVYILTGANRGGKTTITQAIGQLFFMAQGGIYVTGRNFSYKPIDMIFTHFPADEDKTMDLGRLGEECKRFKEIYVEASGNSLILLNETFSTTSFEEGYYIAKDCTKAILQKGIRTIYNTHMHKLAYDVSDINNESEEYKASSLIVCADEGNRSYKI
ncbi:MutS-related protein [Butyrivibrio sp. WCE2006]|uniref:MutS-related protein n=1 Tax=Butyrivibrio sp. WCE2006 TaxID=1410611 RepID=UPI000B329C39|nr:DNA mismatch repair protein [Butyrivibrio sp. WCE2006]